MKKSLFLLTKNFPFGTGEDYISNELKYLSAHFNKIYIYPNDHYHSHDSATRSIPSNAEIIDLNISLNNSAKRSLSENIYIGKVTTAEYLNNLSSGTRHHSFKELLLNFKIQFSLSKLLHKFLLDRSIDPKETVFYSYWFHKSAILLGILTDKKQIPGFVSRLHSVDLYHEKWGLLGEHVKVPAFKKFKLQQATKLYPVSAHGKKFLESEFPVFKKKVELQYLGVESGQISNASHTYLHIVSCSRMDYNKRVHVLAEALRHLNFPVKWTHFGTGPYLEKVKEQISLMPKHIQTDLRGNTRNEDVLSFYAHNKIDIFLNLSHVEGLPVSIMEAMAHGIPVIATSVYGTPEAVEDGTNGFLLAENFKLTELTEKLNYCNEHRQQLNEMGTASFRIFSKKFNAQINYPAFALTLLKQVA